MPQSLPSPGLRARPSRGEGIDHTVSIQHSIPDIQPTTHNPQPTTHNSQPTTHNPQPTTHNPQPTTHNPQPTTHNPQPTTHNSQPTTHNSQPTTHNHNSQPTTHNPQLTNHKSQITNLNTSTRPDDRKNLSRPRDPDCRTTKRHRGGAGFILSTLWTGLAAKRDHVGRRVAGRRTVPGYAGRHEHVVAPIGGNRYRRDHALGD